MIDHRSIRLGGPLASYRDGVWTEVLRRGYTRLSGLNVLRLMACLSRWMAVHRLRPRDLVPGRLEKFARYRRRVGYTSWRTTRGLGPILDHLRGVGALRPPVVDAAFTPLDRALRAYGRYLEEERGCSSSVVGGRERTVREFLTWRFKRAPLRLGRLRPDDVTRFMLRETRARRVGHAQLTATALRSFLRYLHVAGLNDRDLCAAVPRARRSRFRSLPKDVPLPDVSRILQGIDASTSAGRRDRAALLLLIRLGLRRSEVAALRLEDIDWRAGEILVRGKGGRLDRLPLPRDVGAALASYVRHGRPRRDSRRVFLAARAPYRDFTPAALTSLVRKVGARSGVVGLSPHRFRHTAATQMLRKGMSLPEIAQVLRHRHLASTAIYARVDDAALRTLARAWPEVIR
jgi:integrase/recombinase XerD